MVKRLMAKDALIYSLHRRVQVSCTVIFLDLGFRRNGGQGVDRRLPA